MTPDMSSTGPIRPAPLWLLAMITFSGTFAMHVFVPALPLAARDLDASAGSLQLTISFYILGLAFGQLFYGPISDRYGRRPVLMVGLVVYTLASLAAALTPGPEALIATRLVQALGGCAGLVLGRAIVRDRSGVTDAMRRLATMNLVVVLGPGIAPLIGTLVSETLGWRAIFCGLAALGVANLLLTWRVLPETARIEPGRDLGAVLRSYSRLLKAPVFLGYAVGGSFATTPMYGFISAAPFIFGKELHRPPHEVGILIALVVTGFWFGNLCSTRLVRRVSVSRLMTGGSAVSLIGALLLLGGALSGHLSVALTLAGASLFTFGAGLASAAALAEALSVEPLLAGSASGFYGFIQMMIGALATSLTGLGNQPSLAAGMVLTGAALAAQLFFAWALRARRLAAV
ncbi:multidrug effflux MFS transporter [Bosea sp. 124]|uniref:multidrug effflux MFS transporter n=1 Tax=Bosea sp. 124 TaxID=2135642 RepID=UPI000D39AB21|nr:multidrug effflux MFS transporter [Bosea sp. 124]PTM43106.1 DHA1 family bicyclomycin/chloramphenicol resistance-like MFS transporter [Bosea sp. 124]